MPNDNGYVIDFETLQRISKSVREQERGVTKAGMADQSQADQQEGTAFVEVTGAATTAGYYPAREKWYDIESNTWTYAQDPCVAWEMNGSTLDSGKTYKGTLARSLVEGGVVKHVFAVQASGGGGAAGVEFAVLKVTSLLPPYTAKVQIPAGGGTTWSDGATVNFYLTHGEGSWLNLNFRYPAFKYGGSYVICLDPQVVTSVTCSDGNLIVKDRG